MPTSSHLTWKMCVVTLSAAGFTFKGGLWSNSHHSFNNKKKYTYITAKYQLNRVSIADLDFFHSAVYNSLVLLEINGLLLNWNKICQVMCVWIISALLCMCLAIYDDGLVLQHITSTVLLFMWIYERSHIWTAKKDMET